MEDKNQKTLSRTWKSDSQELEELRAHSPSPPTLAPRKPQTPGTKQSSQLQVYPQLPHTQEGSVRGGISKYHWWEKEGNVIPENELEDHSD